MTFDLLNAMTNKNPTVIIIENQIRSRNLSY